MAKDNIFTQSPMTSVAQSKFDLSHDVKSSYKFGKLYPHLCIDTIPGDIFNITPVSFIRFMPMISPVMHKIKVTQDFYFVPNRLVWEKWEDFITGNEDVVPPYFSYKISDNWKNSLLDYFNIPFDQTYANGTNYSIDAIPFAAYNLIYNEYYRDQNLIDELPFELIDGENTIDNYKDLRYRAWNHDYFTSCLPFAQKGDPVKLPLVQDEFLPVIYQHAANKKQSWINAADGTPADAGAVDMATDGIPLSYLTSGADPAVNLDPRGTLVVDLDADAVTINTFRRALKLQEFLERDARGGTRYNETIRSHFDTHVKDYRIQRPEFIGRVTGNVNISEVLATTTNEVIDQPQGNMSGHGVNSLIGNNLNYRCTEHGYIIGLINIQPESSYMDGLERKWTRKIREDYAWPTFAQIGEQEVLSQEICVDCTSEQALQTFGYIPRYSEYRYINNRVSGDMRDTLLFWHMARKFNGQQLLNQQFIECSLPEQDMKRIFAVTAEEDYDYLVAHIYFDISAIRKLPRYGIPAI